MRKTKPKKRVILPDPVYGNKEVTRFVNNLMLDGKKTTAFDIFYDAMKIVENKSKDDSKTPIDIWRKARDNITPMGEVKRRRVGGATFQVPMEVRPDRKVSVSMKNMILYARKRSGKSMSEKLAAEILAAFNEEGGAFKRKEDMHKMAEANRAFSNFRF
jgi:small subunit ribosomal protein S7